MFLGAHPYIICYDVEDIFHHYLSLEPFLKFCHWCSETSVFQIVERLT